MNKILDRATNSTKIIQVKKGNEAISESRKIAYTLNSHLLILAPNLQVELKLNMMMTFFGI